MIISKDTTLSYYERKPTELRRIRGIQENNKQYKVPSLPGEVWKEVYNTGIYFVSNKGRVKRICREVENKHKTISFKREKILGFGGAKEYPMVAFHINGKQQYHLVHRLVAIHFIPNPENKEQVNHLKGTKYGHGVENLEWATRSENQIHAYKIGLVKPLSGEKSPHCKLSSEQVKIIRKLYADGGVTTRDLGKMFNVSCGYISSLINNKSRING